MKRGDVWWVACDPAVGTEIKKTRPAVIVSNDVSNRALPRVVVIPLTSNVSRLFPGQAMVNVDGKDGKVVCDHIFSADKLRLKSRIGRLSNSEMHDVEVAMQLHLGL